MSPKKTPFSETWTDPTLGRDAPTRLRLANRIVLILGVALTAAGFSMGGGSAILFGVAVTGLSLLIAVGLELQVERARTMYTIARCVESLDEEIRTDGHPQNHGPR